MRALYQLSSSWMLLRAMSSKRFCKLSDQNPLHQLKLQFLKSCEVTPLLKYLLKRISSLSFTHSCKFSHSKNEFISMFGNSIIAFQTLSPVFHTNVSGNLDLLYASNIMRALYQLSSSWMLLRAISSKRFCKLSDQNPLHQLKLQFLKSCEVTPLLKYLLKRISSLSFTHSCKFSHSESVLRVAISVWFFLLISAVI